MRSLAEADHLQKQRGGGAVKERCTYNLHGSKKPSTQVLYYMSASHHHLLSHLHCTA